MKLKLTAETPQAKMNEQCRTLCPVLSRYGGSGDEPRLFGLDARHHALQ